MQNFFDFDEKIYGLTIFQKLFQENAKAKEDGYRTLSRTPWP